MGLPKYRQQARALESPGPHSQHWGAGLAFWAANWSSERIHRFAQKFRVSHADVDILGELKLARLLGFLEQTAIEASANAGFDPERYAALKGVWLVRRTRLERLIPVGGGDSLSISTHIADLRRARSLRNYEVERTSGFRAAPPALTARASTDWVYCDVERGRPVSVPPEMKAELFRETKAVALPRPAAVEIPLDTESGRFTSVVQASHLDHMMHVNNAVWADFLEDAGLALFAQRGLDIPAMLERKGALRIGSLDIEYLGNANLGEEFVVRSWFETPSWKPGEDPILRQAIETMEGRRLVRARNTWLWRRKPETLGGIPQPPS